MLTRSTSCESETRVVHFTHSASPKTKYRAQLSAVIILTAHTRIKCDCDRERCVRRGDENENDDRAKKARSASQISRQLMLSVRTTVRFSTRSRRNASGVSDNLSTNPRLYSSEIESGVGFVDRLSLNVARRPYSRFRKFYRFLKSDIVIGCARQSRSPRHLVLGSFLFPSISKYRVHSDHWQKYGFNSIKIQDLAPK